MSIRKVIDTVIDSRGGILEGTIASPIYEYYDTVGNWCYACDVDIGSTQPDGTTILKNVVIANNNRDIIYAEEGKGVTLTKLSNGKYQVTGFSKLINSTVHYIYLTISDDVYTVSRDLYKGNVIRPLTYGELGTLVTPLGYGTLPYGARGLFDYYDNFIKIVE